MPNESSSLGNLPFWYPIRLYTNQTSSAIENIECLEVSNKCKTRQYAIYGAKTKMLIRMSICVNRLKHEKNTNKFKNWQ